MPHKAVVRQNAQSTKTRIVYDASVKSSWNNVSLNYCLETGPPLQNLIWDILVRSRVRPILLCGDLEKAFYQIRIREAERDVLRFFWVGNLEATVKKILRFTRLVSVCSWCNIKKPFWNLPWFLWSSNSNYWRRSVCRRPYNRG